MVYLGVRFKNYTADDYKVEQLSKLGLVKVSGYTGPGQFMFWPFWPKGTGFDIIVSVSEKDEARFLRALRSIPLVFYATKSEFLTQMSDIEV